MSDPSAQTHTNAGFPNRGEHMSDEVKRPRTIKAGDATRRDGVKYRWVRLDDYQHLEARLREVEQECDDLRRENARLRGLLQESQRCLKAAKRQWAPSSTNSDADVAIARNEAALQAPEAKTEEDT